MNCEAQKTWDEFVTKEYKRLLAVAKKINPNPADLVNATYLAVRCSENVDNLFGYFVRVMRREANSGRFKKDYQYRSVQTIETTYELDTELIFEREQMELFVDRLHQFDQIVWKLHVEGYSMVEISNGAGIPLQTLYNSLANTRKTITECFLQAPRFGITE